MRGVLKVKNARNEDIKTVRYFIRSCFEQVDCCLLPNPGKVVATSKKYDGCWSQMDEEFSDQLRTLIPALLSPDNLVMKKINGYEVTAAEFKEYIENYFLKFQSNDLPDAQSVYESMVEKQFQLLVKKCFDEYKFKVTSSNDLMNRDNLQIIHEMSENAALLVFKTQRKMGNRQHVSKYEAELRSILVKAYTEWRDMSLKSIERIEDHEKKAQEARKKPDCIEKDAIQAARLAKKEIKELKRNHQLKENESATKLKYVEAKAEQDRMTAHLNDIERGKQIEAAEAAELAAKERLDQILKEQEDKSYFQKFLERFVVFVSADNSGMQFGVGNQPNYY